MNHIVNYLLASKLDTLLIHSRVSYIIDVIQGRIINNLLEFITHFYETRAHIRFGLNIVKRETVTLNIAMKECQEQFLKLQTSLLYPQYLLSRQ